MTQFAHASAIELLTAEGKLSQYYLGVEYSRRTICGWGWWRLGRENRIPVDAILITYCYHYNPLLNRHEPSDRAHGAGGLSYYDIGSGRIHDYHVPA